MSDNHVRPYANLEGGPIYTDAPLGDLVDDLVTALEVAAIVIPVPEVGNMPALLLSFTHADGTPGHRCALVCTAEELTALGTVVVDAVAAATKAARA